MFSTTTNGSQRQAALDCLLALNNWNFAEITKRCSDSSDFKYEFRPRTLRGFGKRDGFTKHELLDHLRHVKQQVVKEFRFRTPWKLIQGKDQVAIWIDSNGKAINNMPYLNEHIFMITFEPGTNKFRHVVEMQDSLFVAELQDRLKRDS